MSTAEVKTSGAGKLNTLQVIHDLVCMATVTILLQDEDQ